VNRHQGRVGLTERVDALKQSASVAQLRSMRIGLVLSGGGAKCAYQIGALSCLRDLRVDNFDYVAGSSAGAINALAISTCRVEAAVRFWERLGYRNVLRISPRSLVAVIGYLLAGILIGNNRVLMMYVRLGLSVLFVIIGLLTRPAILWIFVTAALFNLLRTFNRTQRRGYRLGQLGWRIARSVHPAASLAEQDKLRRTLERFFDGDDLSRIHTRPRTFVTLGIEAGWFDPDAPTFEIEKPVRRNDPDLHFNIERPSLRRGYVADYADIGDDAVSQVLPSVLTSAALPAVFRHVEDERGLQTDGGLADNVPITPVLSEDIDLVVVINVDASVPSTEALLDRARVARYRRQLYEYAAAASADQTRNEMYIRYRRWLRATMDAARRGDDLAGRDFRNSGYRQQLGPLREVDIEDLLLWIRAVTHVPINADYYRKNDSVKWRLFHTWDLPTPDRPLFEAKHPAWTGEIIHLRPSRSLGGFLRGTLGFRRRRLRRLIHMGYEDTLTFFENRSQGTDL
jgi:predicted acylesterase/phospholipase RssA